RQHQMMGARHPGALLCHVRIAQVHRVPSKLGLKSPPRLSNGRGGSSAITTPPRERVPSHAPFTVSGQSFISCHTSTNATAPTAPARADHGLNPVAPNPASRLSVQPHVAAPSNPIPTFVGAPLPASKPRLLPSAVVTRPTTSPVPIQV